MKVGIDTFGCDHGRSGLGSYLSSLTAKLPVDNQITFELFGSEVDRYTYTGGKDIAFKSISVPDSLTAERLWHSFRVNSFGKKQNYDVILYTAGSRMLPKFFKIPGVAVVNDIVTNLFENTNDLWLRKQISRGLSNADCIIASSQYVKDDLEHSKITCKHIEVIHNGIDHDMFFPSSPEEQFTDTIDIKPFAIKRPYLIYASRMQNAEKKHVELIKAFTLFKERTSSPHRLVIAGSEGAGSDAVHRAALASSVASDIFLTGYFPHENFPELYRGASACIFPSVNEGAGLSVLEAMATGLPTACAKAGALPEVAGENVLYFDSNNIEEMSNAIFTIINDEKLRKRLSEGGIKRAKCFSWEKTTEETIKVLQKIASECH